MSKSSGGSGRGGGGRGGSSDDKDTTADPITKDFPKLNSTETKDYTKAERVGDDEVEIRAARDKYSHISPPPYINDIDLTLPRLKRVGFLIQ
jgi:hypothetical protein